MRYASRKFILTGLSLIGAFGLGFYGVYSGPDYLTGVATIIGAIAALAGQYSIGNAIAKGKPE